MYLIKDLFFIFVYLDNIQVSRPLQTSHNITTHIDHLQKYGLYSCIFSSFAQTFVIILLILFC